MRRKESGPLTTRGVLVLVAAVLAAFAVAIHSTRGSGPTPQECRYIGPRPHCATPSPSPSGLPGPGFPTSGIFTAPAG